MSGLESIGYILFNFALSIIEVVVSIILAPINLILEPILPNTDLVIVNMHNIFSYLNNAISFCLGWLHLPNEAISLIRGYITFLLIWLPISISFRLVIKFYKVFKP